MNDIALVIVFCIIIALIVAFREFVKVRVVSVGDGPDLIELKDGADSLKYKLHISEVFYRNVGKFDILVISTNSHIPKELYDLLEIEHLLMNVNVYQNGIKLHSRSIECVRVKKVYIGDVINHFELHFF